MYVECVYVFALYICGCVCICLCTPECVPVDMSLCVYIRMYVCVLCPRVRVCYKRLYMSVSVSVCICGPMYMFG